MRSVPLIAVLAGCAVALVGCVSFIENTDADLSLPDAKAYTQTVERDIADALPADLVATMDQKETGVFLPCSRDGGEQWAGGLTAQMQSPVDAALVLGPIEERFAVDGKLALRRREDDEDSILEIVGHHHSAWIVRYDRETGAFRVTSFSPCIYLPEEVWRGDKY
ncbi:hypothetical protein M3672_07315 [Microbacterium enclense]|uniref:hypothetical protein n=1 Tax=Microbacterium enclense TaxID=993073 RepID=UPI00203FF7D4|nr:hypothetical protein [Microbacterium enclense]MCM3614249.1 hypothetical protein [Microbacterium enclense]